MTDSMEIKMNMLNCPFCGGEAGNGKVTYGDKTVNEQGWLQDTFYYVNCQSCGSNNKGIVGFNSPTDAINHWNKRT